MPQALYVAELDNAQPYTHTRHRYARYALARAKDERFRDKNAAWLMRTLTPAAASRR